MAQWYNRADHVYLDVGSESFLSVDPKDRHLILLAQIGAAHGIKGDVRVKPFGEALMLDQYGKLETGDGRKLKITRMRTQKSMLVVKFQGVNTREEAEALNGIELFIDRSKLPPPDDDEFYVSDLVGLTVVDEAGNGLGTIRDVPNFGADDMIEIEPVGGGATYYLPFTRAIVPEIDFDNGRVLVIPPREVSERDTEE